MAALRRGLRLSGAIVLGLLLVATAPRATAECAAEWADWFYPGDFDGVVRTLVICDDGTGAALYAGGLFSLAGGVPANNIARWDGHAWSPLGQGVNHTVEAIASFDDGSGPKLYVAGSFTQAGGSPVRGIAKWDGAEWSTVGGSLNDQASTLAVLADDTGSALYVGGVFTTVAGITANRVARWNGSEWSALGAGLDDSVHVLCIFDGGAGPALYAGGDFVSSGDVAVSHIAKWDGSVWSPLGPGIDSAVMAMTVFDDGSGPALLATGGEIATGVARWDGQAWSALGDGVFAPSVLAVVNTSGGPVLYGGGELEDTTGTEGVFQWNGASWVSVGRFNSHVYALLAQGAALYCGGGFTVAGDGEASRVARWEDGVWSAVGNGEVGDTPTALVYGLASFDPDGGGPIRPTLFATGYFLNVGPMPADYVAEWNGQEWRSLAGGLDEPGECIASFDGPGAEAGIYVGGRFTTVGGISANHIARWDGVAWSPLGLGLDGDPGGLAVFDDGAGAALYAAGAFTHAGGVAARGIAKWDGANWEPLGAGISGSPWCFAVYDDGAGPALYVGGYFYGAGGVSAHGIARWSGSSWSSLGNYDGGVWAMTVFDDGTGPALYVGGSINRVDGIFKWSAGRWSQIADTWNVSALSALSVHDDGRGAALYAAGRFASMGGVSARNIARWDGTSWSALDSGLGGVGVTLPLGGYALASYNDGVGPGPALYVGGSFTRAGSLMSGNIARWGCRYERADLNCDERVDVFDIDPFVLALTDPAGYDVQYGNCDQRLADCNRDGAVNVFDIDPFVLMLTGG